MARVAALALVALTIPVVAMVAWKAGLNTFPDETLHVTTASHYLDHWLPPPIGSGLAPYAGVHGVSYFMLWPPQAAYLLFAKASKLTFVSDETRWLAFRGFCVGLWALLVLCALREARRAPWAILLVGLTPQVWYVFTYFSADAFSYAVASLLVLQLGAPKTLARRFLETGKPLVGGVLLGVCFGALALSKMNYMTFALFAVVYCLVILWRLGEAKVALRRTGMVLAAGAVVAGPFLVTDVVKNGLDRDGRFEALREELAAPGFKPSDIASGKAYLGLALRERGVSARAMFSRPWKWGELTYRSFFGVYGSMDIFSPKRVNGIQALSSIALIALALRKRRRMQLPGHGLLGAVSLLMIAATVGAAFWRAWTFDFQAQGRYVFAVIPILSLYLADISDSTDEPARWIGFCVLAICGFVSILSALSALT